LLNNLDLYEARIIGSLIEKEATTPDQYPLSLNALVHACNQKSNRDPVLSLDEATVQEAVDGLVKKYLVSAKTGFGSRVTKFRHRFCNAGFGGLTLSPQEVAIVCELLLRGPQTPGELRTRASRLAPLSDVTEVEATLQHLMERNDGPFVARLPREPGRRESRYMHLFGGEVPEAAETVASSVGVSQQSSQAERVEGFAESVGELRQEIERLKTRVARLEEIAAITHPRDEL